MKIPNPKGILIPIGGGEDKTKHKTVLTRVIEATKKKHPRICLITIATNLPKEVASDYRIAFNDLGITKLSVIHYDNRPEADTAANLKKIRECDAVMLSGGNQLKLSSLLGGTMLMNLLKDKYYDKTNFVIAGTSAGAAAMSDTMIIAGSSTAGLIKGELELTNGLDLINSVFIDTHFTERGRFGRLIQTVTCNPGVLGLGLGEDTAVVITKGFEMEVVGSGLVVIADGSNIRFTDLTDVENGSPITVEGIQMHVLGQGKKFDLRLRKVGIEEPVKKQRS